MSIAATRSAFFQLLLLILFSSGFYFCDTKAVYAQSLQEANRLNERALKLLDSGNYNEAEVLFKKGIQILENKLGASHPVIAKGLNNLAELYRVQGRYVEAESLHKRSLAIREKALGPKHPDVAQSLLNLATVYTSQGLYAEAELLYKRALEITEKSSGSVTSIATILESFGTSYREQGRFTEAEAIFKRVLDILKKEKIPYNSLYYASSLNNLATVYMSQGLYAEGEPLFKQALEIFEKKLGKYHYTVAQVLDNLALVYRSQGKISEVEPLTKRSLAIFEKTLGPNHTETATALNNLAELYVLQDRYAEAEPIFIRARSIYENAVGPEHPSLETIYKGLASIYEAQSRYAEVEPLLRHVVAYREKGYGPYHPYVAMALNDLANLYANQGRYMDAMQILTKTIASRTSFTTIVLGERSDKSVAFNILLSSEKNKVIDSKSVLSNSFDVLQFTSSSTAANAVQKLAQRFAAGSGELANLVRKDQDIGTKIVKLDNALLAALSKTANERNAKTEEEVRQQFVSLKGEQEKLSKLLAELFPDYVALSKPEPLTLSETQSLLLDDEAVLAFDIAEKHSYAWVVTKEEGFWTEIPILEKDLIDLVKDLRASLTFAEDKPFDAALSYKIYQNTFGPIAEKIAGKKHLSIVTNGALTSLPFGLLVTSDPSGKPLKDVDWLIKTKAITVLPSIYSLKTMRFPTKLSPPPKPLIAFADPVFSKAAKVTAAQNQKVAMRSLSNFYQGVEINIKSLAESLPQLPGTREEVETIAKSLAVEKDDVKLGLEATETVVKKSKLDDYKVVYFATHGLVAGDLEKFSKAKAEPALALSIPDKPSETDDGLLQASEIAELKLNADWVILSACNTASSDGVGAEPLSGLARAFLYAGGKSLLVSHWEVDDVATAKLMSTLFTLTKDKPTLSHGELLQEATLQLLNSAANDNEAHPRVWAPFVVVGEPLKMALHQ